jgi:uncharacterized protein (TIGR00369 family)
MEAQIVHLPKHPDFEAKVRLSFGRQAAMAELGIQIKTIKAGLVELSMVYNARFTQQHGFMHAGILTTALDSACGYAAFSLMPEGAAVLTAEFKTNLLAPARGDSFTFVGRVVKSGRTLSFCEAQAFSVAGSDEKLIATMSGTIMAVRDRRDVEN